MFKNLRLLYKFFIMLLCGSTLVSCFDDTEVDISGYNDLMLSAVSFGTLPRIMHTTTASGRDSIYTSTVSASTVYPFTIDHLNNVAYNLDSLPVGTRADKIIFSTFTVREGSVVVKKLTADEDTLYATADTLDFSKGSREFTLYGVDGTSKRKYKVEVRIHNQKVDSVTWRKLSLDDWKAKDIVPKNYTNEYSDGSRTFRVENNMICVANDGENFTEDDMESAEADNLPTDNFAWHHELSRIDKNVEEVTLYGTVEEGDSLAGRIWRRNIDMTGNHKMQWEYLPATFEVYFPVRGLRCPSLCKYDKGLLLTGIGNDGRLCIKYSPDYGRSWKNHVYLRVPSVLKDQQISQLQSTVDADGNLWLLINEEEVWYGRAHSVMWDDGQRTFIE